MPFLFVCFYRYLRYQNRRHEVMSVVSFTYAVVHVKLTRVYNRRICYSPPPSSSYFLPSPPSRPPTPHHSYLPPPSRPPTPDYYLIPHPTPPPLPPAAGSPH